MIGVCLLSVFVIGVCVFQIILLNSVFCVCDWCLCVSDHPVELCFLCL